MTQTKDILWTVLGFGEVVVPPGKKYECDNRDLPNPEIVVLHYVIEGETFLYNSGGEHTLSAGNLLVCRHGENSFYRKSCIKQNYTCLWMNLSGSGLAEHYDLLRARHGSVFNVGEEHPVLKGMYRLCSMAESTAPAEPLVMAAAIHRLTMTLFAQAEEGFHGRLSPVNVAIHRLISTPLYNWNIKELAAQCGCSREYLSRKFAERYGQSPQEYLIRHRGERALYLLQHTALPLSAITSQSGFSSTATLTRQIRRMTGKSPQQLRPVKKISTVRGKLTGLFDESQL